MKKLIHRRSQRYYLNSLRIVGNGAEISFYMYRKSQAKNNPIKREIIRLAYDVCYQSYMLYKKDTDNCKYYQNGFSLYDSKNLRYNFLDNHFWNKRYFVIIPIKKLENILIEGKLRGLYVE